MIFIYLDSHIYILLYDEYNSYLEGILPVTIKRMASIKGTNWVAMTWNCSHAIVVRFDPLLTVNSLVLLQNSTFRLCQAIKELLFPLSYIFLFDNKKLCSQ